MLRWRLPPCESALAAFSRNCALTLTTMFHRKDHQLTEKEMRKRHGTGRSEKNLSRTYPSQTGLSRTDPSEKGLSGTDPSQKGLSGTDPSEMGPSVTDASEKGSVGFLFMSGECSRWHLQHLKICICVLLCFFIHIRIVFVCCSACAVR
jgi:hypothetical protein